MKLTPQRPTLRTNYCRKKQKTKESYRWNLTKNENVMNLWKLQPLKVWALQIGWIGNVSVVHNCSDLIFQTFTTFLLSVWYISNFRHSVSLIFCIHSNELITRVALPFNICHLVIVFWHCWFSRTLLIWLISYKSVFLNPLYPTFHCSTHLSLFHLSPLFLCLVFFSSLSLSLSSSFSLSLFLPFSLSSYVCLSLSHFLIYSLTHSFLSLPLLPPFLLLMSLPLIPTLTFLSPVTPLYFSLPFPPLFLSVCVFMCMYLSHLSSHLYFFLYIVF